VYADVYIKIPVFFPLSAIEGELSDLRVGRSIPLQAPCTDRTGSWVGPKTDFGDESMAPHRLCYHYAYSSSI
jgi:hypothetical protein